MLQIIIMCRKSLNTKQFEYRFFKYHLVLPSIFKILNLEVFTNFSLPRNPRLSKDLWQSDSHKDTDILLLTVAESETLTIIIYPTLYNA